MLIADESKTEIKKYEAKKERKFGMMLTHPYIKTNHICKNSMNSIYKSKHSSSKVSPSRNNRLWLVKTMGYREACRFYGVPFATVHDHFSGKVAIDDKKLKVGPNPVLGEKERKNLLNGFWIWQNVGLL